MEDKMYIKSSFQENKSTSDRLIELENYLHYQQANNKISCGIFLDLKKAFDTIDHTVLKQELIAMDIRGVSFDLIFSIYQTDISLHV